MADKWLSVKGTWYMALNFFLAATNLAEGDYGSVPLYLYCHSLELCFKAFLYDKGQTTEDWRKRRIGHNLKALFEDCEAKGLSASFSDISDLRELVEFLNNDYCGKQFEYSETCIYTEPNMPELRESVSKLIAATKCLWIEPERSQASRRSP